MTRHHYPLDDAWSAEREEARDAQYDADWTDDWRDEARDDAARDRIAWQEER